MRRIVLTGLALICVIALGSLAGTREPRSAVIEAAPTQNPQPVAVTNFPAVQGVTGTVNVGNLPAVQNVTGTVAVGNLPAVQNVTGTVSVGNLPPVGIASLPAISGTVSVGNLPLDASGNLRVAPQGTSGSTPNTIDMTFLETDRNAVARFPLIPLPPGFGTVAVSVLSLDETKAHVSTYQAGFGSASAPLEHSILGNFQLFPASAPLDAQAVGTSMVQGNLGARYAIAGTSLQLAVFALAADNVSPPPPDTQYFVHLYMTQ